MMKIPLLRFDPKTLIYIMQITILIIIFPMVISIQEFKSVARLHGVSMSVNADLLK